jgi:deoxyribodipyrimidine photo-lyase
MDNLPALRVRHVNDAPPRPGGRYVLYWMNAARRTRANFALQGAWRAAQDRGVPLLVLEAIGLDHAWASPRFHRFVLDGMRDQAARLGAAYYPYVERAPGAGRGLLAALARDAALVVTDDWPCFHLPRRVAAAGRQLDVALLAVDSNGLLPLRDAPATPFPTAYAFRRHLQARLPKHLAAMPVDDPLPDTLPAPSVDPSILARWEPGIDVDLATLPLDHEVGAVAGLRGGAVAAEARLTAFLGRLDRYAEDRNDVSNEVPSGLSPYLHFGHVASHTIVQAVLAREGWTIDAVRAGGNGSRSGWWHASAAAEAFLDQVVTWRELGFNLTSREAAYDRWDAVPAWARATLEDHAGDVRPHVYDRATLERAATHDPLWNAAQRQLREEGRIHNYLRMLWGKKVLEWSATPQEGFATLVALNDRWALDGRDPNSYTGIGWVFGKYDRPWGPRRPIFGTIRYMSSDNTAKKMDVRGYLARWGTQPRLF